VSAYERCRTCDLDLKGGGAQAGAWECCCNAGYCHRCCPETVARRAAALVEPQGEEER